MKYRLNFPYLLRAPKLLLVLLTLSTLWSCNINKYLEEDQYLVEEVAMNIEGQSNNFIASDLKDELENLYKIHPNNDRKSLRYYRYKDKEDLGLIKRWIKKKLSEEPSILDSLLIEETATTLENYLKNKKGFYQAEVDYDVKLKHRSRRADIKYKVKTAARYTINQIVHLSTDSTLKAELKEIAKESFLKEGDPIDALTFDLEKQRIVSEFQKIGYADFNLNNLQIKGDSSDLVKKWDVFIEVNPPGGAQAHTKYDIGALKIYTDYHQDQLKKNLSSEELLNKEYYRESSDFLVRPSTLNRKIYLEKGDTYNSENYYNTLKKLYSLGSYRFAKIAPEINAQDSSIIDYNIFLTPHNNKWILDFGLESFFSTLSVVDDQLVGVAFRAGLEDRNAFGGSERFKVSVESGVEFNPRKISSGGGSSRFINSSSLGLNSEIQIPTLTKPLNVLRLMDRLSLIKDKTMTTFKDEGLSDIALGINYVDIFNYYSIFSINADYGYDLILNKRNRITFNQIGVNYTTYEISDFFKEITNDNKLLENSFKNNLFTGFLFKDLTYVYNTDRPKSKSNFIFYSSLELSGLEVYLANELSNAISGNNNEWKINSNSTEPIEYEKLIKLGLNAVWYSRSRRNSQLAARIKTGIAVPFGSDDDVSFIKQYFVGGPSSLRAWRPMHLGPGTYISKEFFDPNNGAIFYQRGDLNLEANLEYRFDLLWLMEGALFVDAGNVWTLQEDKDRPGSQISKDFLSQLAVGYGYGIRFDFTYFLIRFDLGLKLLYPAYQFSENPIPYREPTSRWVSPRGQGLGNFNIAVAYPF